MNKIYILLTVLVFLIILYKNKSIIKNISVKDISIKNISNNIKNVSSNNLKETDNKEKQIKPYLWIYID